jgi:hypothetical protein
VIGWKAIKLATENPGVKVSRPNWEVPYCIDSAGDTECIFDSDHLLFDDWEIVQCTHKWQHGIVDNFCLICGVNQKVVEKSKPKPKMIKWYRPKVVWLEGKNEPQIANDARFYSEKKIQRPETIGFGRKIKVLEWEVMEAPENWEQCE